MYHFTGPRQTNRLDKPEWFYTQILNWARDNHIFVGTHIQPALNLAGHSDINIRVSNAVEKFIKILFHNNCSNCGLYVAFCGLYSWSLYGV